ncbi:hypothetical protein EZV62_005509 [Acer yangbiense]|uniref:Uncharacterized protein n=1 Tax=Acer yangbiense TaxID=1000413 RepID=A0A5C7INX8_9ROSI|nr:hypothetical protein EZV62_005509 [Acer yangbiense]
MIMTIPLQWQYGSAPCCIKKTSPELLLTERSNCKAKVELNAMNDYGFIALDILDVLPQDGKRDMEIAKIL